MPQTPAHRPRILSQGGDRRGSGTGRVRHRPTAGTLYGLALLRDLYTTADLAVSGRVTVPVLWDRQTGAIVPNESAGIIRKLNSAFDAVTGTTGDDRPQSRRAAMAPVNDRICDTLNKGVNKADLATTQAAPDAATLPRLETRGWLGAQPGRNRYPMDDTPTKADWRLFTALIRLDTVCHRPFRCNRARIVDHRHL